MSNRLYGTIPVQNTILNITYSDESTNNPSSLIHSWNVNDEYGGVNSNIIRAEVWSNGSSIPIRGDVKLTLVQGIFSVDFFQ